MLQTTTYSSSLTQCFVKARGLLVVGEGKIATITKAVKMIDERAKVRDMSIVVITKHVDLTQIAEDFGALPRTAGVMVEYAETFLFDDAFDSGVFHYQGTCLL